MVRLTAAMRCRWSSAAVAKSQPREGFSRTELTDSIENFFDHDPLRVDAAISGHADDQRRPPVSPSPATGKKDAARRAGFSKKLLSVSV